MNNCGLDASEHTEIDLAALLSSTDFGDGFSLQRPDGTCVDIARLDSIEIGQFWRIVDRDKTYVIPYSDRNTLLHSTALIRQYIHKHAAPVADVLIQTVVDAQASGQIVRDAW